MEERMKRKSSIVVKGFGSAFWSRVCGCFFKCYEVYSRLQMKFCYCLILLVLAGTTNFTGPRLRMLGLRNF